MKVNLGKREQKQRNNEDTPIVISDSEETASIPSIGRYELESEFPIISPSESTVTANSSLETAHSARDIDTEGKTFLTIIDAFSKLGQALEISSKSTPEVARALIKYFSVYGVPNKISSDPGTEFNNILLKETLQFYKIELHIGTPHNPNSMGLIERFHSTILEIYRIAKYEHKITDAASVMTYAVMSYNQSIHSTTGLTPFEVVFGHTSASSTFNVDFCKEYTQKLVRDHVKRTKYLYKFLTDKIIHGKKKIQTKHGGEKEFSLEEGDEIFIKGTNTRRSKDKNRYQKAKITGEISRNVVPVSTQGRDTTVPVKDIRRPPQMLYITIDEVENAIAFSKLRTLHQSLIETEELLEILIKVSKSNKLMYEVNLENLSKLEQCIEIKAYSKQNQITFVLEVPLVDRDMYTYYKVIPLPVTNSFNQTVFIIPKNPYLLAKGLKTVSLSTPCKEIDKEMFLCNKDVLQSTIKDSCIDALMKLSTNISSCTPVVAKTGKPKIEPIEDNQWILYSKTTILLTKMCNSEETIERLCGTYILILDDECRAKINNIVLQPLETLGDPVHFSKLPIVEFPEIPVPAPLPERKTYNLDETELSKLEHFASKYDETGNIRESAINTHSISGEQSDDSDQEDVLCPPLGQFLFGASSPRGWLPLISVGRSQMVAGFG
ncbi:uncharacterized protein LOC126368283 [Pectinophora gossypiella]|uniref:uncharacterized protein LOC126368283 n=1 Tax=Pectinophora gossypiella TaxID=13191 RepID=UPI00214F44C9|nr:uncharacterized protein LOC126368283 [Pectinophora gossypiella]